MRDTKVYRLILLLLLFGLCLVGCDAMGNRATLRGTVTGVYENSIMIDSEIGPCSVSLPEGDFDLAVGDTVEIIFSGEIAESYPMQIHHVYDIKRVEETSAESK